MSTLPVKYKLIFVKDKTGIIKADHKNKKLFISDDIKVNVTDDGKLCATFKNFRTNNKSSVFGCFSKKYSDTDCAVIISDYSRFNHCIQKNGIYQLSGDDVIFNGTDNDDTLILKECANSKINMNSGDDTILYREKSLYKNTIDLGKGNNIFAAEYQSDADRALIENKIISGKGNDHICLRNAINNKLYTGYGNDLVEIIGAPHTKHLNYFKDNLIYTEKGDDVVNVSGKFDNFQNNNFYLGKGNDTFSAEINKYNDKTTELGYLNNFAEYKNSVSGTTVYATDGKKGWFENDSFSSTSYSANRLGLLGFKSELVNCKPIPKDKPIIKQETKPAVTKKMTTDDYKRMYWAGSLGYNLFCDPKMQENAFKALDGYVNSMLND